MSARPRLYNCSPMSSGRRHSPPWPSAVNAALWRVVRHSHARFIRTSSCLNATTTAKRQRFVRQESVIASKSFVTSAVPLRRAGGGSATSDRSPLFCVAPVERKRRYVRLPFLVIARQVHSPECLEGFVDMQDDPPIQATYRGPVLRRRDNPTPKAPANPRLIGFRKCRET